MVSVVGGIFIAIFVVLIVAAVGWVAFTQLRARRLGLPPPSFSSYVPFRKSEQTYGPPRPAPGGIVGWVNDRIRTFKNRNNRSATGAYEQPLHGANPRGGRGFGPLDPDEAWDARVGHEADSYGPGGYYEEQELNNTNTAYTGGGNSYNMNLAATPGVPPPGFGDEERGRTRSREPDNSRGSGVPGGVGRNPFDDDAEPSNISMRGVSPRPIDTNTPPSNRKDSGDSPSERRSVFRENM